VTLPNAPLGPPPYGRLRSRIAARLEALRSAGAPDLARAVERELEAWSEEQREWDTRLIELLRVHHDINNALVGVSGNAQLLMRDPVAERPGVRERLEVVVREAQRIQGAAARLRELKSVLAQGDAGESRAA